MECAALAQSPSDFATVDPEMLEAVALLCPGAGTPSPAATTSPVAPEVVPPADPELAKESEAAKKVANNGSFFVGSEILPGVWQSDLARVTDCYWEISDAQGNIIDNNFITLAPQFTVTIPADAVGFTASGCGFHWVSE